MYSVDVKPENSNSLTSKILMWLSPRLARESNRLEAITKRSNIVIQSYSDMSDKIKKEVDENHFSQFLNYEKHVK
jgi:hypothetical protein